MAIHPGPVAGRSGRIDMAVLKQAHSIEDIVAGYGVELRRQGRALVGRCLFHADGGRPNLYVFGSTNSWYCFRCGVGGDVVKFVMLAEDVGFVEAVERLTGASLGPVRVSPKRLPTPAPASLGDRDAEELAVLQAAATLYHHALLAEPRALAYLSGRGLDRTALERCRLGYATGDQLLGRIGEGVLTGA